jgi:hypothetical protein
MRLIRMRGKLTDLTEGLDQRDRRRQSNLPVKTVEKQGMSCESSRELAELPTLHRVPQQPAQLHMIID